MYPPFPPPPNLWRLLLIVLGRKEWPPDER